MHPDLEVIFYFNGTRKTPIYDGFRPAHRVSEDYLSTGIHHYYDVEIVLPDGTAQGTITFLNPEYYPACCWVGKKLSIQDGRRVIGYAVITRVINPILLIKERPDESILKV